MKPTLERFERLFEPEPMSGCFLWTGALKKAHGYGVFYFDSVVGHTGAHRASWMLYRGPLPDGTHVLHRCDNTYCVNPSHLFLGTHEENMRDMKEKGRARGRQGQNHGNSKLKDLDVMQIRALCASGNSYVNVASRFGVSKSMIGNIVNKLNWAHLP